MSKTTMKRKQVVSERCKNIQTWTKKRKQEKVHQVPIGSKTFIPLTLLKVCKKKTTKFYTKNSLSRAGNNLLNLCKNNCII